MHLRAEGGGKPITAVLTGGERHEQIALEALLDQGAVRRPGRGRPRLRPRRVAGDKAYSSPTARRRLRRRGIVPVIPTKRDQKRQAKFDREAYRARNRVERLINRLKQFRRIATRYEKRGVNYLAMLTIGMILLWIPVEQDPRQFGQRQALGVPLSWMATLPGSAPSRRCERPAQGRRASRRCCAGRRLVAAHDLLLPAKLDVVHARDHPSRNGPCSLQLLRG